MAKRTVLKHGKNKLYFFIALSLFVLIVAGNSVANYTEDACGSGGCNEPIILKDGTVWVCPTAQQCTPSAYENGRPTRFTCYGPSAPCVCVTGPGCKYGSDPASGCAYTQACKSGADCGACQSCDTSTGKCYARCSPSECSETYTGMCATSGKCPGEGGGGDEEIIGIEQPQVR